VRLGPYEILAPLGAGGMGEVYRARDTRLEREVALKILPGEVSADAERRARFHTEAKAVAALSHPNILAIHDFGDHDGAAYAVMELLEGQTLRDRLSGGALPARKAGEIGAQIARGLAAAHEKGIVHRDVKPENVFITTDGRVKVLDFGLARHRTPPEDESQSPTLARETDPGTVLGTVGYRSPEQVKGQPADARSDIFSFGAVCYEMLTGRRAFKRDTAAETMTAILKEDPPELLSASGAPPPGIDRIVRHCLEKQPAERFQSARDLAFNLEAAFGSTASGSAGRAAPASRTKHFWPLLAGLALLAAGFGVGRLGRNHSAASPTPALFTQITDLPGLERQPSLSPDGRSLLYVGDARGNDDIYLLRIGGRRPINLTEDSPLDDSAPAFSLDGSQIAFRSERAGGGIFVMGATGESVRRVTDYGYDPAWSPDGKELVLATEPLRDPMSRMGGSRLFAVRATGEGKRPISESDGMGPKWSPDGRFIAYWGVRPETWQRDLWTVAADASGAKKGAIALTDDASIDWGVEWSPDGRFLYFSSNRGGTMNLLRLPIDPRSGAVLGAPEAVTTPAAWAGSLSFAKDGRQFAFGTRDFRADAWRIAFDPDREALLGRPLPILRGQPLQELDWSPDGTSLVFARRGLPWESLGVVRADGSGYDQLTDAAFQHRWARWSPDGQRLSFQSQRGGTKVWVMRKDGSALQEVRGAEETNTPVWSPDGRRIAGGVRGGVALFDPSSVSPGEPVERLALPALQGEGFPIVWSWSPNGRWLLCSSARVPRDLFAYSFEARSLRHLDESEEAAAWLSDSRRVLFSKRGALLLLDTVTGRRKELLPPGTLPIEGTFPTFSVTRDGRSIAYLEARREGDIWLAAFGGADGS
jgi:serine/threonine protein kinase/Tol biopolymer transport system component